jgi:hypothetical protein
VAERVVVDAPVAAVYNLVPQVLGYVKRTSAWFPPLGIGAPPVAARFLVCQGGSISAKASQGAREQR